MDQCSRSININKIYVQGVTKNTLKIKYLVLFWVPVSEYPGTIFSVPIQNST
jgi:hypothetical protein